VAGSLARSGRPPLPASAAPAKVTAGYRGDTQQLTVRNLLDSLSYLSRISGQRGDHYHLFRLT
jgi:hypothetical protein